MRPSAALLTFGRVVGLVCALGACHRRRGRSLGATVLRGPRLGAPGSMLRPVRAIGRARRELDRPFRRVLALPSATLGLAGGTLYRLPLPAIEGGEPVPGVRDVLAVAPGGGDVVYALVGGAQPFVTRSDDAGAHWTAGAAVAALPLPEPPDDASAANPEQIPGLAAHGRTVAFWLGATVLLSRDGGASFAPRALGGTVHSLVVTARGTLVAVARLDPPAVGDPTGVVRDDGAAAATEQPFASADACAPATVYALADGAVLLGGERGLLGLCARRSSDDGRHFVPLEAPGPSVIAARTGTVAWTATPSGLTVRTRREQNGASIVELSEDGRIFAPVRELSVQRVLDAASDGSVAVALADGLARRVPGATDHDAALFAATLEIDPSGGLAIAAGRDVLAVMNAQGTITAAVPGPRGPRLHVMRAPCGFAPGATGSLASGRLAVDGRGELCCIRGDASITAPGSGACTALGDVAPQWRTLGAAPTAVFSGDGAIALLGAEPGCRAGAERVTERLARGAAVLACAAGGFAVAARASASLTLGAPLRLESSRVGEMLRPLGAGARMLARADGSLVVVDRDDRGSVVLLYPPGQRRAVTVCHVPTASAQPAALAAWDGHTTLVTLGTHLVSVSRAGCIARAFAGAHHYAGVARIGDELVGVTPHGRFELLASAATIAR